MLCLFTYRRVLDERDKLYGQLADYLQMKNVIEHIKVTFVIIILTDMFTIHS